MSDNHLYQVITSDRTVAECVRLQTVLNERNQQLQIVEQQFSIEQNNLKHSRQNMRLLMAFCVLLIVAMVFGGAA